MLRVEIRIKGRIAEHWSVWFDGLTVTPAEQDETLLCGEVIDQSALYGLLARLRDLGLPLVSVDSTPKEPQDAPTQPSNSAQAIP